MLCCYIVTYVNNSVGRSAIHPASHSPPPLQGLVKIPFAHVVERNFIIWHKPILYCALMAYSIFVLELDRTTSEQDQCLDSENNSLFIFYSL